MSLVFCIIGVICGLLALLAAGILFLKHDENDIIIMSVIIFLADVIMLFIIGLSVVGQETLILDKNVDHNKTKIIEVNGEPTELYITVNGEEYHFTFKEDSESDK
jgi:hypothetical protein